MEKKMERRRTRVGKSDSTIKQFPAFSQIWCVLQLWRFFRRFTSKGKLLIYEMYEMIIGNIQSLFDGQLAVKYK